jgi:hypothetical protein
MEIKTKDFRCVKDIGGEGEMIACSYKKKVSAIYMHPSSIILENVNCERSTTGTMLKCSLKSAEPFVAGQMWSDDFDYCGMLQAGKEAKVSDGEKNLRLLFNSFEDVNYHKESEPLWDALKLLKDGKKKLAETKVKEFNKRCAKSAKETC